MVSSSFWFSLVWLCSVSIIWLFRDLGRCSSRLVTEITLITGTWLPQRGGITRQCRSKPAELFTGGKGNGFLSCLPPYIWALSNLTLSVRKSISYIDQNLILGTRHLPADIDDINIDEDGDFRKQSFSFYAESWGPFLVCTFSLCVINIFPLFFHCTSFETWTFLFSHILHTVGGAIYLCSSIE